MIFHALQHSDIWTSPSLVNAAGVLVAAFISWLIVLACSRQKVLPGERSVAIAILGVAIGYWLVENQATIDSQWNQVPVRVGVGVVLFAIVNLFLIEHGRVRGIGDRINVDAMNILPTAGLLLILGGSQPIEILLGIELVSWGQSFAARSRTPIQSTHHKTIIVPNFLSLTFIVAGMVLCNLESNSPGSPTVPLGYLLFCVGVCWKFWLIPLKNVFSEDDRELPIQLVFNQLLWGIPATLFLFLKSASHLPEDAAQRLCVLLAVVTAGIMVFGAALSLTADGWKRLIAGLYSVFFGQLVWTCSLRLWELTSPDRNLTGLNDWPGAQQVMLLITFTWVIGLTGICICLRSIFHKETASNDFETLSGVFKDRPLAVLALTLSLVSLAGLPLTPGFWSTLFLLVTSASTQLQSSLTELYRPHAGFLMLSTVGVLTLAAVVSIILRVCVGLWMGFQRRRFRALQPIGYKIMIVIIGVLHLVYGLNPESLRALVHHESGELRKRRETEASIRANPADAISHLRE